MPRIVTTACVIDRTGKLIDSIGQLSIKSPVLFLQNSPRTFWRRQKNDMTKYSCAPQIFPPLRRLHVLQRHAPPMKRQKNHHFPEAMRRLISLYWKRQAGSEPMYKETQHSVINQCIARTGKACLVSPSRANANAVRPR